METRAAAWSRAKMPPKPANYHGTLLVFLNFHHGIVDLFDLKSRMFKSEILNLKVQQRSNFRTYVSFAFNSPVGVVALSDLSHHEKHLLDEIDEVFAKTEKLLERHKKEIAQVYIVYELGNFPTLETFRNHMKKFANLATAINDVQIVTMLEASYAIHMYEAGFRDGIQENAYMMFFRQTTHRVDAALMRRCRGHLTVVRSINRWMDKVFELDDAIEILETLRNIKEGLAMCQVYIFEVRRRGGDAVFAALLDGHCVICLPWDIKRAAVMNAMYERQRLDLDEVAQKEQETIDLSKASTQDDYFIPINRRINQNEPLSYENSRFPLKKLSLPLINIEGLDPYVDLSMSPLQWNRFIRCAKQLPVEKQPQRIRRQQTGGNGSLDVMPPSKVVEVMCSDVLRIEEEHANDFMIFDDKWLAENAKMLNEMDDASEAGFEMSTDDITGLPISLKEYFDDFNIISELEAIDTDSRLSLLQNAHVSSCRDDGDDAEKRDTSEVVFKATRLRNAKVAKQKSIPSNSRVKASKLAASTKKAPLNKPKCVSSTSANSTQMKPIVVRESSVQMHNVNSGIHASTSSRNLSMEILTRDQKRAMAKTALTRKKFCEQMESSPSQSAITNLSDDFSVLTSIHPVNRVFLQQTDLHNLILNKSIFNLKNFKFRLMAHLMTNDTDYSETNSSLQPEFIESDFDMAVRIGQLYSCAEEDDHEMIRDKKTQWQCCPHGKRKRLQHCRKDLPTIMSVSDVLEEHADLLPFTAKALNDDWDAEARYMLRHTAYHIADPPILYTRASAQHYVDDDSSATQLLLPLTEANVQDAVESILKLEGIEFLPASVNQERRNAFDSAVLLPHPLYQSRLPPEPEEFNHESLSMNSEAAEKTKSKTS